MGDGFRRATTQQGNIRFSDQHCVTRVDHREATKGLTDRTVEHMMRPDLVPLGRLNINTAPRVVTRIANFSIPYHIEFSRI